MKILKGTKVFLTVELLLRRLKMDFAQKAALLKEIFARFKNLEYVILYNLNGKPVKDGPHQDALQTAMKYNDIRSMEGVTDCQVKISQVPANSDGPQQGQ